MHPVPRRSARLSALILCCLAGCAPVEAPLIRAPSADAAAADRDAVLAGGDADPRQRDDGPPDARPADAGPMDAGHPGDGGPHPDAGGADAGLWDARAPDLGSPLAALGLDPAEIDAILSLAAPLAALPDPTNRVADDPEAAALGQALFFADTLGPGLIDCPFCHVPDRGFSAPLTYDGTGGLRRRNVPSLLNAAVQPWFFWDGRADTQWAQVITPLEDPEEMDSDRLFIARAIADSPDLRARYVALFGPLPALDDDQRFPQRATPFPEAPPARQAAWAAMAPEDQHAASEVLANVGKAIAAYQRRLVVADSPFDRFAEGVRADDAQGLAALTPQAIAGLRLFIGRAGCLGCHWGPAFSEGAFHNLGQAPFANDARPDGRAGAIDRLLASPFNAAGPFSDDPNGPQAQRLAALAATPQDVGAFRTPTLRNVALTGPYGHDGRYVTLEEMVRYKAQPDDAPPGQRDQALAPVALDDAEVAALVAFLESLTSAPPPAALTQPPAP